MILFEVLCDDANFHRFIDLDHVSELVPTAGGVTTIVLDTVVDSGTRRVVDIRPPRVLAVLMQEAFLQASREQARAAFKATLDAAAPQPDAQEPPAWPPETCSNCGEVMTDDHDCDPDDKD